MQFLKVSEELVRVLRIQICRVWIWHKKEKDKDKMKIPLGKFPEKLHRNRAQFHGEAIF